MSPSKWGWHYEPKPTATLDDRIKSLEHAVHGPGWWFRLGGYLLVCGAVLHGRGSRSTWR